MIPCFIALYFSKDWHSSGKKLVIKRWRFGLARGLIMSFAQLCLYTSYLYLPYALVATMEYTGPMMITLLAIPLLGEKFGWYKSLAVLTGFVGIIFIMQPWSESFNFYMLLPVMAAFGYSLARPKRHLLITNFLPFACQSFEKYNTIKHGIIPNRFLKTDNCAAG